MLVRALRECKEFIAGDGSLLRELLHPAREKLDLRYSLAHATVRPHEKSKPHRLKTSEVYYILEGTGVMHMGGEAVRVIPGQTVYIPPGSVQHIENTGDSALNFLCIVDPAWRREDEEVL